MNKKKFLAVLAMTMSMTGALTACGFNKEATEEQVVVEETPAAEEEAEVEEVVVEETPTPEPSNLQGTSYKSADGVISLEVPDTTWTIKSEENNMVSFESPENGKILIMRGTGDALNSAVIPDSEDMANSLEKASSLEEGTDYQISNYANQDVNGNSAITYTVKYLNTEKTGGVYYTQNKFFSNANEYVSVAASTYKEDADLLNQVTAAVNSLTIGGDSTLNGTAAASAAQEAAPAAGQSDGTAATDTSANYSAEQLADTAQTRTVYRNSDGAPFVLTMDSNGNWVDRAGVTYRFMDNGIDVYDQNDVDFYFHGEAGDVAFMSTQQ